MIAKLTRTFRIALLLVLLASVLPAFTDSKTDEVDKLFAKWAKADSPGCAVAVVQDGKIVYKQGYGMANLEYGVPITPSTIFHIASISKQFTAFAILLLEADGKLSIDDDIHKYLPEMHDFGKTIAIQNLLHHTSGLRDHWELATIGGWRMDDVITQNQLLKLMFGQKELNFYPGERFTYCNSGFTMSAEIVSRVGGMPFDEFCQKRIFEPLGMANTHFHLDHQRIVPNRAYSYFPDGDGFKNAPLNYSNSGATSLFTTVEDLAKWDQNFYDAKTGGFALIEKMQVKGKLNNGEETGYACGLAIGDYKGLKTVGHGGADAGFRSIFTRFPEKHFSAIVLSNDSDFDFEIDKKIADIYLKDAFPKKEEPKKEEKKEEAPKSEPVKAEKVIVDPALFDEYTGEYEAFPSHIINVYRQGDQLFAKEKNDSDVFELIPQSATQYHVVKIDAWITFIRDDKGKITQCHVKQGGQEHTGPKLEPFNPSVDDLKKYEGLYYSDELQTAYTVAMGANNQLQLKHQRHPDGTLTPVKKNRFSADVPGVGQYGLYFICDTSGNPQGFRLDSGDRVINLAFYKTELVRKGKMDAAIHYPTAKKDKTVDDFHGTSVSDPYRWMEDPKAPDTVAWVERENRIARDYLNAIPSRAALEKRLTEIWDYPKYSIPSRYGNRYFFSKNTGLQNQSVLYMQNSLKGEAQVLIDPNTLSPDGTVALSGQSYSKDGTLMAYFLSQSGSDWNVIKIRNLDTGEEYPETIQWVKFTNAAWKHDKSGFYYSRYPEPNDKAFEAQNSHNKVYWHKLGTPQSEDTLVFEMPDQPDYAFTPTITDDGQYLLLYVHYSDYASNRIYYRRVESNEPFIRLLDAGDALYEPIECKGKILYFKTDLDAPRGRAIAIDTENPDPKKWKTVIPQQDDVMSAVSMVNSQFVVQFMRDAHHILKIYTLDGQFKKEIELPTLGAIGGISGQSDQTEMFFSFTSFLYPGTQYRYDFTTDTLSVFRETEAKFDPAPYETKQVFYPSKDGTKIPMFLTYKKGLEQNGNNPALLYGYGGFDISITPSFSTARVLWLENGGVLAVANLRGGSEYGKEWHAAGMFEKKQNVFDDFIAAGEWLIANHYTSSPKLAIQGGSNGGLLVSACMLQRPDLFGAVICQVPVTDMLRFHKFTVGKFWTGEYGNAEQSPEHFKFLYAYSPLHNVKDNADYPPILVTCADTDDRVVPSHSKKFVATLQEKSSKANPILIRIDTKAGHGAGKPTSKIIEEQSDIYAFLFKQLGME